MSLYVGGRRAVSNVGTHSFVKENLAREWIRGSVNGSQLTETDLNNIYMVKPYGFANDNTLTELTLPNCSYVSQFAFTESSITNISLPICQYINANAFSNAYNLQQISIPNVVGIPSSCFTSCQNLQEISLPSATYVEEYGFNNCTNLTRALTPNVTTFYGYSFYYCSNLEYVDTSAAKFIYRYAFYGCSKLDSADLSSCYRLDYQAFQSCSNLRKVWLPSSIAYVQSNGQVSPFYNVNPNCIIYTNIEDENSVPRSWSEYWNNCATNTKLNVIYGATHEDFINETLPTYPYTLFINVPNDCVVKIKYMGIEKNTNTITMKEGTTASYLVERENCIPINGSVTMETTDVTITITSDQFVVIPSTLDINYNNATTGDNPKILASLVDDYNFELNSSEYSITNSVKTHDSTGCYGYIVVKPTNNSILSITSRISSEQNYDFGGVYVDTSICNPTWTDVRNGGNPGTGSYLMIRSGTNMNPFTSTMSLEKDIIYYINFFYIKDSSDYGGYDKVYFDEISVEKEMEIDIFEQVISGEITTIDNSDVINLPDYVFSACYNLTNVNLPNVTTIGYQTFSSCTHLQTLNIPKVTEIFSNFISSAKLTELDLPNVISIDQCAITDCTLLTKIWISDKCTNIYSGYRGNNPPFRGDTNLTIYTNLLEAPIGWDEGWDYLNYNDSSEKITVVWGATHEDFENA